MEQVLIFDSEGSFSHHLRAPDRRDPSLAPPQDDVHPMWGVHLHRPATGEDGSQTIPHVTLEWMASWHGFDPDELPTILDVVLHCAHVPDPDDVLAWTDARRVRLMAALHQDLPDPMTPGMPYQERREVILARAHVVKTHLLAIEPAPLEDRAGALCARAVAVRETAAALAEYGMELPPQFALGLDEQAPEHPLDPILKTARLDPARVAARRARDEWVQARQDASAHRALVAMRSPMTFGQLRRMPPPVSEFLAAIPQSPPVAARQRRTGRPTQPADT